MTKEQILAVANKKELTSRLARDCIDLINEELEFTEEDIAEIANLMLDFINRPARQNIPYTGIRGFASNSAIMCNHDESPADCECPDDCYCKSRTCKDRKLATFQPDYGPLEFGGQKRENTDIPRKR